MSDIHTIVRPDVESPSPVPKVSRRIILLSGRWQSRIRTVFDLEATIFVSPDGSAVGDILWIYVDAPGAPAGTTGVELVQGTAQGMRLELQGYQSDAYIACDHYSIRLCGSATTGEFAGESLAYGWGGACMSGTYHIVEQRD
jgi:hypothetical protein